MKKLLITSLFLGSCVLLLAQKTTKIPNVYKPVRSEMYKKGWIDFNKNGAKDTYEDPTAPIDARIEDLLSQMTLEEKTCQMVTLYGYKRVLKDDLPTSEWKNQLWKDGIGAIDEHLNGFQQWGLPPSDNEYVWPASKHAWALNEVQRFFIEETRLGIPTDFTNEGIRGVESYKATNFPTQLGLGHTWNRQLIHQVGLITGREARMLGYTNVYAPILDVGRDQRWGRYEEVYGESPYLVAELGIEMGPQAVVSIIGFNSCEYFFSLQGSWLAGCVPAGIYTTNSAQACYYVLHHSEATICVCEGGKSATKIASIRDQLPNLKAIIVYWPEQGLPTVNQDDGFAKVYSWDDWMKLGASVPTEEIVRRTNAIKPGNCATLIYTSGTTVRVHCPRYD